MRLRDHIGCAAGNTGTCRGELRCVQGASIVMMIAVTVGCARAEGMVGEPTPQPTQAALDAGTMSMDESSPWLDDPEGRGFSGHLTPTVELAFGYGHEMAVADLPGRTSPLGRNDDGFFRTATGSPGGARRPLNDTPAGWTGTTPLFRGLSLLNPEPLPIPSRQSLTVPSATSADGGSEADLGTLEAALESPSPAVPAPWVFKGNGGRGVKTWFTEAHVLEINPRWLDFSLFESMDLTMLDKPPGPGESGSKEWRSTFTVGLSTDWNLTPAVTLRAGYRFYDNPVSADIPTGAFPNASQHVVALGVGVQEGPHSLALMYGIDMMDAATSAGISSVRHGSDLDPLAHLVSLKYGFSF